MPSELGYAHNMYANSQPVQQAPGGGGGNRYIPPTFNYRQGGRSPYSEMDWNNVQNYNLPQQGNNPFTQQYMGGLRESLGGFGGRYPRNEPRMPQFQGGDPYGLRAGDFAGRGRRGGGMGMPEGYVSDRSEWFDGSGNPYDDPNMVRPAMGIAGDDHNPIYDRAGNRINRPGGRRGGGSGMPEGYVGDDGFDVGGAGSWADRLGQAGYGNGSFGGMRGGGGRGMQGFDPRMLMAMMYRGMSPEQMFGGGGNRGGNRERFPLPEEQMQDRPLRIGGYDPIASLYNQLYPQGNVKPDPVKPGGGGGGGI